MPEKTRIVIIEDITAIREGFAAILESAGNFIVPAKYSNCEAAIANLKVDLPDVVLMDIGLPGMSGIEGTAIIKKQLPLCTVIIITVMEESEKVFQSLCAGASGYIVKNSNSEDIVKTINEALAGGAPMSLAIAKMVVSSFRQSSNSPLSERETAVLQGISEGKSYSKIALDLFISKETVRSHIKNIYSKLAVSNKEQALKVANDKRWLSGKW
ncbi:MAG: response regulator transcription factor [Sphingobacteriaceae bacterium]|nr:MAG: response regulator transcription factor [Sphingobacteriaceae bacterium]